MKFYCPQSAQITDILQPHETASWQAERNCRTGVSSSEENGSKMGLGAETGVYWTY